MDRLKPKYEILKVPPVMYDEALKFIIKKYTGHVWALAQQEIEKIDTEENADNSWAQNRIVEMQKIIEECQKYTDKAREYKTRSYTHIPVNLEGWAYENQVCKENVRNKLFYGVWDDGIKVILDFQGHKTRGGVWKDRKGEIQVDVPLAQFEGLPSKCSRLKNYLIRLANGLHHEFAHVAQTFIGYSADCKHHLGGLPSHNIQMPDAHPNGNQGSWNKNGQCKRTQIAHPLRDIEFYPRLNNDIQDFLYGMRDIEDDPEIRRRAVRIHLTGHDGNGESLMYGSFSELDDDKKSVRQRLCRSQPKTLSCLQRAQPDKYREACRRFVKALTEVGFLR